MHRCCGECDGTIALGAIDLNTQPTLYELVEILGWRTVIPIVFALMGTLIIARQRGNRVGWLMMVVALALINPLTSSIEKLTAPPETTRPGYIAHPFRFGEGNAPCVLSKPIRQAGTKNDEEYPLNYGSSPLSPLESKWVWYI